MIHSPKKIITICTWMISVFVACLCAPGCGGSTPDSLPNEITLAGPRDLAPGQNFFFPESLICRTWESLVGVGDKAFAPVPELARAWKMSEDGKAWTFYLRKGVVFHDGTPFNADAVLVNFRRYKKAPGKTRFYRFRMNRYYPGFSRIEKKDDNTVTLFFHTPIPGLPNYMAGWGSSMFSPASLDPVSLAFKKQPAGTGPFVVESHRPERYVVLRRFDRYWGKKAISERIRIRVIPDVHTRFSALKSGEIQGVIDLGGITPVLAKALQDTQGFQVSTAKNSLLHFIALNGERFPFNTPDMRRALSLIIDRKTISQAFFCGYFPPAGNILSHASAYYRPEPVPYSPQEAKRIARKVLRGKRVKVDLVLPSKVLNYPYKDIAQYLQSVMADIGMDVTIRQVESGGFNDILLAGDYHLYIRCQGLPHADPAGIFEDYMQLQGSGGMDNATQNRRFHYNYSDPRADALISRAASVLGEEDRKSVFNRLQDLAADTLPVIPLVHGKTLVVNSRNLSGYTAKVYGATLVTAGH